MKDEYVVKVIASGLAGLEALPHFLDELTAAGVPLLRPLALDHDSATLEPYKMEMAKRMQEFQKRGYVWALDDCYEQISGKQQMLAGIAERNPKFLEVDTAWSRGDYALWDKPIALAVWASNSVDGYWNKIFAEWRDYRRTHPENKNLIILIPYCPEGPTSGTVGIWFGSLLKKEIKEASGSNLWVAGTSCKVLGIELCPAMPFSEIANQGTNRENAFRGYVARKEEYSALDPKPFDLCFTVDAWPDYVLLGGGQGQLLLQLDKAAARVATAVIKGVAGGDWGESLALFANLPPGGQCRWKAHIFDVMTDTSVLKVLPHLIRFPEVPEAHADNETTFKSFWTSALNLRDTWSNAPDAKAALMKWGVTAEMVTNLMEAVNQWENKFKAYQDLERRRKRNILVQLIRTPFGSGRLRKGEMEKGRKELKDAARESNTAYSRILNSIGKSDFAFKQVPFGYTVDLSKSQVAHYLKNPTSLAQLMPAAKKAELRNSIADRITACLTRHTWTPAIGNRSGNGQFDKIIIAYMGNVDDTQFPLDRGGLALHVSSKKKDDVFISRTNTSLQHESRERNTDAYNLDFSIVMFAGEAKMEDVGCCQDLAHLEYSVRTIPGNWRGMLRYYVNPPTDLVTLF